MTKKLIKSGFIVVFFLVLCLPTFSIEVNEPEIKSVEGMDIEFINYTGPHAVINTLEEIKSIGRGLGTVIAQNTTVAATAGSAEKYYVIHAVDPTTTTGLDADILFLGPNASVDHVRNLRHIIAAYLTTAYGYTEEDAETLAVFVTVYNAVYRGNMDNFTQKYKKIVTDNLTADKVGLSVNYQDWPGNSQIVIPLQDPQGGIGTVDTTIISDKEVVDSLRKEDDMGIDDRKDLVEIKEKEADAAEEKAAEAQQQAAEELAKQKEEQQKLADAKKEADQAKKEANAAQKEATEAQKKADENPNDKEAQEVAKEKEQEAQEKQQIAEEKEEIVKEQQEKTDEQKQIAEDKQKEAEEYQKKADQKREEARNDRAQIAKDQQQLIIAGRSPLTPGVYGLKIIDDTYSAMVKINKENGTLIKESPVRLIRGRTILPADENYMAIAGQTGGNAAVKVVLLDTENMEIIAESTEVASETAVLVQDGADYYTVIKDGSNWVVAKYNSKLQLQLKSNVPVHPSTPITLTESGLVVTDINGIAKLLDYTNLGEFSKAATSAVGR